MQSSLMFVDLKPLGVTPDCQKIAIKMPQGAEGLGEFEYSGFADIINALMSMAPEELQHSLGRMDWVEVQGDGDGYAPLIDLSAARENHTGLAGMLTGQTSQNTLTQKPAVALTPAQTDNPDAGKVNFIRSHPGKVADQMLPPEAVRISNVEGHAPSPSATRESIPSSLSSLSSHLSQPIKGEPDPSQSSRPDKEGLARTEVGSVKDEMLDGKAGIQGNPKLAQHRPGRHQANLTQVKAPSGEEADTKGLNREDLQVRKETAGSQDVNVHANKSASKQMDSSLAAADIMAEESMAKTVKRGEPVVSRMAAQQNLGKLNASAGHTPDQQFENGTNGQADDQLLAKQAAKAEQASDGLRQQFKLSEWEGPSALADDAPDPLNSAKQEARELFQQIVSRTKGAAPKPVENLAGRSETAAPTNDAQTNVIRQIVQRMHMHQQGSQSTMTLKLKPEFLGNVHMQISTENQQVVVRMATESLAVKEMVEQGLQHLKTEMQHHGLEIDKFDVFVSDDKESSQPGQDLAGFRRALKQRQQNAQKKGAGDNDIGDGKDEVSETETKDGRTVDDANEIDYFA